MRSWTFKFGEIPDWQRLYGRYAGKIQKIMWGRRGCLFGNLIMVGILKMQFNAI